MKYQCTVCGQIIDNKDICPICGSDHTKIMAIDDKEGESTTYRCLSCGRVFENKDMCPFCGGEELYDLTHDKMFNRNDVKRAGSGYTQEILTNFMSEEKEEEKFEDKPVDLSKVVEEEIVPNVEEKVEEDHKIEEDVSLNEDILVESDEKKEDEEQTPLFDENYLNENKEEVKEEEPLFENILADSSSSEEEVSKDESNESPFDEELTQNAEEEPSQITEEEPAKNLVEEEPKEILDESVSEEETEEVVETKEEPLNEEIKVDEALPSEENKEEHDEECCCHHHHEHDEHCCCHEGNEEDYLEDAKLDRVDIIKEIIIKLLKESSIDNKEINKYLDILDKLEGLSSYSLDELKEFKIKYDNYIFEYEKTPLNGYMVFLDEEDK